MSKRLSRSNLQVSEVLVNFIENEALPETGINKQDFWDNFEKILNEFVPKNKNLLETRRKIKNQIDDFYKSNSGEKVNSDDYIKFLKEINYIVPVGIDFKVNTENVDLELSNQAGPQLVVPVTNARYALNAANARWGSLYDALYGTDAISEDNGAERTSAYNPIRGQQVINYSKEFLDKNFSLENGSHKDAISYELTNNSLLIRLKNNSSTALKNKNQYIGYQGLSDNPTCILLKNNNLHIEIIIDKNGNIGSLDSASINDIILESALTTIQDCEDSVATVDAEDKVLAYRNWLGLMKGDLEDTFEKNGKKLTRSLNPDKIYTTKQASISYLVDLSC